jgi:phosphate transport system substrate-binding protein
MSGVPTLSTVVASPLVTISESVGWLTSAIFTSYLSATCPEWKDKVGEGKIVKWPIGIGGNGNDGVARLLVIGP